MKSVEEKYKSTTHYLLASLVPYTEANLKLAFIPKYFFADLAKLDKAKQARLRTAYYRCIKQGLVELNENGQPLITAKGLSKLAPYKSKHLKNSKLMLIFDITESERKKRNQLRVLLKQLEFIPIQKSVWMSKKDSREYLTEEIKRLNLESFVQIFEAREL